MSDWSIYELEDIDWDDFDQSGERRVPRSGDDQASEQHSFQGDCHKKPCLEALRNSGNPFNQEKKGTRGKMLEQDPWSQVSNNMVSASCEVKRVNGLEADNDKMSSDCFGSNIAPVDNGFCADDAMLDDKHNSVDNSTYDYPLSQISQSDDISFLDDCEDKESSDLLYYGWPDIGNFEDVDRIFRSCDSSFGIGDASNEDEMGWFSSEVPNEGTDDVLKAEFKFPCSPANAFEGVSEDCEPPKLKNYRSYHVSNSKEEVNLNKKHSMHQNQKEGKRKGQSSESGGSNFHIPEIENANFHFSSMDTSSQHKQNFDAGSFNCPQTGVPYLDPNCDQDSDRTMVSPTLCGIKTEKKSLLSVNPRESSIASNQTSYSSNSRHGDMSLHASILEPVSVEKQVCQSGNEFQRKSDVGVRIGISVKPGSRNANGSSSMNSGLDEISLEATSFCQLQKVMEQLDLRTKLCIRDSLYRLAKSAEQRNNYPNLSGGGTGYSDTSGALMAEGTDKCTGFMDIETDTNPIDRSVAHLLFHRPSDASPGITARHTLPLKPNIMIHGSPTSTQTMVEKLTSHDELAAESESKIADDR